MQIKINRADFFRAGLIQQTFITSLRDIYEEIQPAFEQLAQSWKGAGGAHFGQAAQEIAEQALMGILMSTALSNQSKAGRESIEKLDLDITLRF